MILLCSKFTVMGLGYIRASFCSKVGRDDSGESSQIFNILRFPSYCATALLNASPIN